jgi:GTPase SAR1 family protein
MRWKDRLNEDGEYIAPPNHEPRLDAPDDVPMFEEYEYVDGPKPPEGWQAEPWTEPFEKNVLHRRWKRRVVDGDPNDFVVAISASPKDTGVSGTGKTTLALKLAKNYFDVSDSGFDAETQATLQSSDLGEMYRENEKGSALIFDEAQGVTANSGVNARRAMASSTIDAIGNVAANRMRAMTLIIVSQNIKWLDKNLLDLVDCWIRIKKEPNDPRGPEATASALNPRDLNFENWKPNTPAITDLTWSDIPDTDADYRTMERLKREATSEQVAEPDDTLPVELRNKKIRQLTTAGIPQKEVAEAFDLSPQRISQIVSNGN